MIRVPAGTFATHSELHNLPVGGTLTREQYEALVASQPKISRRARTRKGVNDGGMAS